MPLARDPQHLCRPLLRRRLRPERPLRAQGAGLACGDVDDHDHEGLPRARRRRPDVPLQARDEIQVRIMGDQDSANEDVGLGLLRMSLYGKSLLVTHFTYAV